jgi:tetratricopeptide (TPR) repeat protein
MSWLISEEAGMATYAGDPGHATQLLERVSDVNDRAQRANAASSAARAHAQLGDRRATSQYVAEAERWSLTIANDEDSSIGGPHWSFSQVSGFTRIAEAWLELGMSSEAIGAAQHATHVADANLNPRLAAHAELIMAASQAQLGNIDGACEIASTVFAKNLQDFHTVAVHAKPLLTRLADFEDSPVVSQLLVEFDHYLRTGPVA